MYFQMFITQKKHISVLAILVTVAFSCSKNNRLRVDLLPTYYATPTTIQSGGYIVDWGNKDIISRGICYAIDSAVILDENYTYVESESLPDDRLFTCTLTNLISDTTYYICAFAKTNKGRIYQSIGYTVHTTYTIGSTGPGGGIVFAVDGDGGGMEVIELVDHSEVSWGCQGVASGSTDTGFGYGLTNTGLIVTNCGAPNTAAVICDELVLNGYDDWYLPSLDELQSIQLTLYAGDLIEFGSIGFFWSSTEQSSTNAWAVLLFDGSKQSIPKTNAAGILAIRNF